MRLRTGSADCENALVSAGSASSYLPSADSDMASNASTFGNPGLSRMASRSGGTALLNLPCWK
jgi:hypothetical protein